MNDDDKNAAADAASGTVRIPVSVTLPTMLLEAIDYLAGLQKRSRSNMIEVLISHGLVAEASGRVLARDGSKPQRRMTDV
jgi:hypothetical protein